MTPRGLRKCKCTSTEGCRVSRKGDHARYIFLPFDSILAQGVAIKYSSLQMYKICFVAAFLFCPESFISNMTDKKTSFDRLLSREYSECRHVSRSKLEGLGSIGGPS